MDEHVDILALFKATGETPGGEDGDCWAYDELELKSGIVSAKLMNIATSGKDEEAASSSAPETKSILHSLRAKPSKWTKSGSINCPSSIHCVAYSPDGSFIVVAGGSSDYHIRLYSTADLKLKATLSGHSSEVYALAFIQNGAGTSFLVSGSADTYLKFWDLNSNTCVHTMAVDYIYALCFDSATKTLFVGCNSGQIHAYNTSTIPPTSLGGMNPGYGVVYSLALSPDGTKLASGHSNNVVFLWNVRDRSQHNAYTSLQNGSYYVCYNGLTFSNSGRIVYWSSSNGHIHSWNLDNGQNTPSATMFSHGSRSPIARSPDGEYIVSPSNDYFPSIFCAQSPILLKKLDAHSSPLTGFSFSPDGAVFVCVSQTGNTANIQFWRTLKDNTISCPSNAVDMRFIRSPSLDLPILCVRGENNKLALHIVTDEDSAPFSGASSSSSSSVAASSSTAIDSEWIEITYFEADADERPRPCPTFHTLIPGKLFKIADNQDDERNHSFEPIYLGEYGPLFTEETKMLRSRAQLMDRKELEFKEKQLAFDLFNKRAEQYSIQMERCIDTILSDVTFANLSSDQMEKKEALAARSLLTKFETSLREELDASMRELRTLHSFDEHEGSIKWDLLTIGDKLGNSDGFGSVYLCTLDTGDAKPFVTIKIPTRTVCEEFGKSRSSAQAMSELEKAIRTKIEAEINKYRALDHPNLLRCFGSTVSPSSWSSICVVQQYCMAGDLHTYLASNPMTEEMAFGAALQIASAMKFVHAAGAVHRDLKPGNILVMQFSNSVLDLPVYKIAGLGQAKLQKLNKKLAKVQDVKKDAAEEEAEDEAEDDDGDDAPISRFCPPELMECDDDPSLWTESVAQDLWAYGLTLYQIRTGQQPYGKASSAKLVTAIREKSPGAWPKDDEVDDVSRPWAWLRFISEQCYHKSPEKRLAHFRGQSAEGKDAFDVIEKRLYEMRPDWAKQVHCSMLKFQRMEIRDPYLKMQRILPQ